MSMHAEGFRDADAAIAAPHLPRSVPIDATLAPAPTVGAVGRFNAFLSSIATLPPDADFLTTAATAMAHLLSARLLALSTFDPATDALTCHALVAPSAAEEVLQTDLKLWPPGVNLPITSEAVRQTLLCGKLQSMGSDEGLLFGNAPTQTCIHARKMLGITACYVVGMVWRDAIVGCIMFGMAGADIVDADLVEACAHQVAALHQQRLTERMLNEANAELEARVCERTAQLQAANRALQASEEKYRRLFDNAQAAGRHRPRWSGGTRLGQLDHQRHQAQLAAGANRGGR